MIILLRMAFVMACLALLSNDAAAGDNDLIILMSVKDETTKGELKTYLRDALADNKGNEACEPVVTAIPRRVFDRFSRMMNRVATGNQLVSDGTITEVKDELTHWHINVADGITPKNVVLQWREFGGDMLMESAFPVQPQGAGTPNVTAQEVSKKVVLVRAEESWNIEGYRLEWEKTRTPETGFTPWPQHPPTYVVVLRDFKDIDDAREKLFEFLRHKGTEVMKVDSPSRPLKLVSIDMDPPGRLGGIDYFKNNYTIAVPSLVAGEERIKEEPLAWVLFPLSLEEKDKVLEEIRECENLKLNGGIPGLETVAAFVKGKSHGYEYVGELPIVETVADLPTGMPQPTAILDRSLKPRWYEVPPQIESGRRVRYARTLQVAGDPKKEIEATNRHWMVVVYARQVGNKWRAGQPSEIQKKVGTKHSTTIEAKTFQVFFEKLARQGDSSPSGKEKATNDAPIPKQ